LALGTRPQTVRGVKVSFRERRLTAPLAPAARNRAPRRSSPWCFRGAPAAATITRLRARNDPAVTRAPSIAAADHAARPRRHRSIPGRLAINHVARTSGIAALRRA
jgi:hypothetical protein